MNVITEAILLAINSLEYDGEHDRADTLRALLTEVVEIDECHLYECYNHRQEGSKYCIYHQPIKKEGAE